MSAVRDSRFAARGSRLVLEHDCTGDFGFQGGLYDPDTGLVEFGCRWYDAETGRWISKDPIGLEGGWNVYAFCDNDPVNRTDPTGLCEDGVFGMLNWGVYELDMSAHVRHWYEREVGSLDGNDASGRSALKEIARQRTPCAIRRIIETARPGLGPRNGSTGHANISNFGANRIASGMGKVARGAAVLSIAVEIYNIASAPADERHVAVAVAGGHIIGGIGGGKVGAAIGSVFPGYGTVIGAVVGGLAGSFVGGEICGIAIDALSNRR